MTRVVAVAIAASSAAVIPYLLVGGLAVLLQEDLAIGEAQLGVAVAAFFASGAVAAPPAGRLVERLGPRKAGRIGIACVVGSLLGIGLIAQSWALLVLFLALGGAGSQVTLLGANVLLARSVAARRQGLAFGAAQAAVPVTALLAGLSVPAIGLTVGWRWAFLVGAGMAALAAAAMPSAGTRPRPGGGARGDDAPLGALVVLAVGIGLAAMGGSSTAAFLVASSVDRGLAAADAGLALAAASLVGLAVRLVVGWLSDRLGRGALLLVAMLIGMGAVGYGGLAVSQDRALIVLFAALAFGGGWGWPGLLMLAVSRSNPVATGTAMGVVSVGGTVGHMLGPVAFGMLAEQVSFSAGWLLLAAVALLAAGTVLVSRQRIQRARSEGVASG